MMKTSVTLQQTLEWGQMCTQISMQIHMHMIKCHGEAKKTYQVLKLDLHTEENEPQPLS